MSQHDDDIKKLYSGWGHDVVSPSAPRGGGGVGSFKQAKLLGTENILNSKVPHPESPVGKKIHSHELNAALAKNDSKSSALNDKKKTRLDENRKYLENTNIKAFLAAISVAEGGDYNLKFGGVKGKKNDKWQFSDFSTHPGAGSDGKTTAAGMYQINKATWKEMGDKMGLIDFSSNTQDLLAVEILRSISVLDSIMAGNVNAALSKASRRWAALPQGKGKSGRYPGQHSVTYDEFITSYEQNGGKVANAD